MRPACKERDISGREWFPDIPLCVTIHNSCVEGSDISIRQRELEIPSALEASTHLRVAGTARRCGEQPSTSLHDQDDPYEVVKQERVE